MHTHIPNRQIFITDTHNSSSCTHTPIPNRQLFVLTIGLDLFGLALSRDLFDFVLTMCFELFILAIVFNVVCLSMRNCCRKQNEGGHCNMRYYIWILRKDHVKLYLPYSFTKNSAVTFWEF